MNQPEQHHLYAGKWVVIILFSGIVLATYGVTWVSVHHPKSREYKAGRLVPVVTCEKVLDEESLVVRWDERDLTIRLLGIESPIRRPESLPAGVDAEAAAETARKIFMTWIYKKRVGIHFPEGKEEHDESGRHLAYVDIYGVDIGRKMLREGRVLAADLPHPKRDDYQAYEREARDSGKGIWKKL